MTSNLEVTGKMYQEYSNTVQNWRNRLAVSDNFLLAFVYCNGGASFECELGVLLRTYML